MATQLSHSRIEDIGLQAARQLAGPRIENIALSFDQDSTDETVYVLSFLFDRDPARENTARLRRQIALSIRDRLVAEGDEHFPIVQFLTRDDWTRL